MSSLAAAWFIARKDVALMVSRRETILWVFVMPIVFFYFIGTVTGGFAPAPDRPDPIAVRGAAGGGVLADQIVQRLEAQSFKVVQPASDREFETFDRRLTLPAPESPYPTFTAAAAAGRPQTIRFDHRTNELTGNYDEVRVAHAVYEVLADLAVVEIDGQPIAPSSFQAIASAPRALTLSVTSAGRRRDPPIGFAQAVPGTMVMFTMLVLLTVSAVTLVLEREHGLLRRLASAPISPAAVVLGKWIGRMLLAIVQIAFAMLIGTVLFHMRWGATLPMIALVLVSWAGFTASLAILLANVARTEAQTVGIGVFGTQVLAALGGCWWPIEITPAWMQKLALALPTGWTMDALHKLVSFGDPATSAVPHVAALLAGAVVLGWMGARRFRYA